MKKMKVVIASLATLILGGSSFLVHEAVSSSTQELNSPNTQIAKKDVSGVTSIEKSFSNDPLFLVDNNASTNRKGSQPWTRTGFEKSGTRSNYDTTALMNKVRELARDGGQEVDDSQKRKEFIVVPADIWKNNDLKNEIFDGLKIRQQLQELRFEEKSLASPEYRLKNSLALTIPKDNNPNRQFASAFIKFMKTSNTARSSLMSESIYLQTLPGYRRILDNKCTVFETMENSSNPYQAMMGKLYNQINCQNLGFGEFDFSSFLTSFFEVGQRNVYVSDTLNVAEFDNMPVMTTAEAKRLTDKEVIPNTTVQVGTDMVGWLETLTIDKLRELPAIFETLDTKFKSDEGLDTLAILNKIVNSTDKLDVQTTSSLFAVLTAVIAGVDGATKAAKANGILEEAFLSKKDFFTSVIETGTSSVQKLVQKLIFGEETFNEFFIDNSYDLTLAEYDKDIKKIIPLTDNSKVTSLGEEIEKLKEDIKEITVLINEDKKLDQLDEIEQLTIDIAELNRQIDEQKLIRDLAINRITLLKSDSTEEEREKLEKERDEATRLLSSFGANKNTKQTRLNVINQDSDVMKYSERLSARLNMIKSKNEKTSLLIKIKKGVQNNVSTLSVWRRQREHLIALKTSSNKVEYAKNIDMTDVIQLGYTMIKNTAISIIKDLGFASIDDEGEVTFNIPSIGIDNLDPIKPLFHNKTAVAGINKLIDFANKLVESFPKESLDAASKLLYNVIPKEALEVFNLEFTVIDQNIKFADGINIGPNLTYGWITGASAGAGLGVGAGVGAVVGGLAGGKTGAKIGAGVGAGVGALVGAAAGSGTAYHYFNDGYLKINKPSKVIVDLFKKIEATGKKGKLESTFFNFFTDGHTLLKQIYLEDLNALFSKLGQSFLYNKDETENSNYIYNIVEEFSSRTPAGEKFTPWSMVGETFKTFLLSPETLLASMEKTSYSFDSDYTLFSQETVDRIKKNTELTLDDIKYSSGSTNEAYVNELHSLQLKLIDWLAESSLLTSSKSSVDFGDDEIKIGFNPEEVKRITVQRLIDQFIEVNGIKNNVVLVEYTDADEKNASFTSNEQGLAARFDYMTTTDDMHEFSKMSAVRQEARIDDEVLTKDLSVPIMETRFVILTHRNNIRSFIKRSVSASAIPTSA